MRISETYFCSKSLVHAYLTYGRSWKNPSRRPYKAQVKHSAYKPRQNFYRRFKYDPAKFIAPLHQSLEESISLEELSLRLHSTYKYLPHLTTLERIADYGNPRTGETILEKVSTNPPLYRLVDGLYKKYKANSLQ